MGFVGDILAFLGNHPYILLSLFLLYCFIYVLSIFMSGPKPGRNPFSASHVKPAKPLVLEHSLRNKILKQRFKPAKVPEDIDTIVIGSGIGGLSTAVMLGRAGHKVLVLEQHDQAGGCCHTFVDKGYEFDTGIHYVGKMMEGDMTRILIDQITEGQVQWHQMEDNFDHVAVGPSEKAKFYSMKSGSNDIFRENLEKQFPTEKEAIRKYMELLKDCRGCFIGVMIPKMLPKRIANFVIKSGLFQLLQRKYLRLCRLSTKKALDQLSDNEEFKSVLSYIFGDMGAPPSQLSIFAYSQLINHYIPGAFYPLGGTSEIAFQIIQIIERYGGRVLVDAPVSKILLNPKGRAHGVRITRNGSDIDIFAKRVISDAGAMNTFRNLLPKEIAVKSPIYHLLGKVGPSISNMTVFVGINGSTEDLKLPTGNTWAFTGQNLEGELTNYLSMSVDEAADADCPLMFISFPAGKDPSWEKKYPGKCVALLITLTPWSWFSEWEQGKLKHRGDDYDSLKMRIGHQMWKQCQQLYPQLEGTMDYIDVGTPLSNKYYLGQPEGEMYGLDHGLSRFEPDVAMHLRPETGIRGLYLTGQDVITAGFSGALHAGVVTAGAILHRNLFNDLTAVTKEIRKQMKEGEAKAKKME